MLAQDGTLPIIWQNVCYHSSSHYVLPYWNYTKVCAFTNLRELANLAIQHMGIFISCMYINNSILIIRDVTH